MIKGGFKSKAIQVCTIVCAILLEKACIVKAQLERHIEKIYAHKPSLAAEKETLEDIWTYYYAHPIELYNRDIKALDTFGIASKRQIDQLSAYTDRYGPLKSIYELQAIPSWNHKTIRLLLPFIKVSPPWHVRARALDPLQKIKFFMQIDRTSKKEHKENLGNQSKILIQYQLEQPNIYRMRLMASKEPHEPLYSHGQGIGMFGPLGYWSGYGMIENKGILKKLILGDYQIGLGEGLILGTAFAMDKSQEVIKIKKAAYQGIKPETSSQRKSGFRGLAFTLHEDHYEWLLFFSRRHLDATLHRKEKKEPYVTTLHSRGISYSSLKAFAKKDTIHEEVVGTALIYKGLIHPIRIGVQTLYNRYSLPINFNEGLNHHLFFQGKKNVNMSLFGDGVWENYHCFGEIGHSYNNSIASIGGVMAALGKKVDSACMLYHYPAHFHSLYGKAFGKKGHYNRNKQGVYLGVRYTPIHALALKMYIDLGKHLAPQKSLHHQGAHAQEMMIAATYKRRMHGQTFTLMLKGGQYPKNAKGSTIDTPLLAMERKGKIKLKGVYAINKKYNGQTQLQLSPVRTKEEAVVYGVGVKQLLHYKKESLDLKGWVMLYHSPKYDTAIRFYTHNLRGGMSYPAHYGHYGCEGGLIVRYRLKGKLRIGLCIVLNRATRGKNGNKGWIKISFQLTYQ